VCLCLRKKERATPVARRVLRGRAYSAGLPRFVHATEQGVPLLNPRAACAFLPVYARVRVPAALAVLLVAHGLLEPNGTAVPAESLSQDQVRA
jgi:hypothetical protein